MFAFLKRMRPMPRPSEHAAAHARRRELEDGRGWLDSAGELLHGAEITEIEGDFADTVLHEHFPPRER